MLMKNISILVLLLALGTSSAMAQDAEDVSTPEGDETIESGEPAVALPEPQPEPQEEVIEQEDELPPVSADSGQDPMYWAGLRDVYTVQKRSFQKQGRFALTAYAGLIPNNAFEQYFPVGLRLNYFVLENIGLELASSYAFKTTTGLQDLLSEPLPGLAAQGVLVGDTQLSHTNFGIVWSPFYGKTAFYNSILNYFDVYLFAGAGLVITETIPEFNAEPESEFKPEGALGAGIAFYLGEHAAIRIDYRQFIFAKVEGVGGVATPSEASAGFSWFF